MESKHTIYDIEESDKVKSGKTKGRMRSLKLVLPILKLSYEGHQKRDEIYAILEKKMNCSPEDLKVHIMLSKGDPSETSYKEFEYTGLWAIYHLRKNKLIEDLGRGSFKITDSGKQFIESFGLDKTDSINPLDEKKAIRKILETSRHLIEAKNTHKETLDEIDEYDEPSSETDVNSKYGIYQKEGRIKFVTFHPSFYYEQFVEGVTFKADKQEGDTGYEVKDGIFKEICKKAIHLAVTDYNKSLREVDEKLQDLEEINQKKYISQFLKITSERLELRKEIFSNARRCVLIIDEINRGDVSKILGELITLLESDKRLGEDNELIVELPCSGDRFGVPPNLHIIGTMNTADRSLSLIDVALRRRFEFKEMRPELKELQANPEKYGSSEIKDNDFFKKSINALIKLNDELGNNPDIGKDKKIGHAFFCNIKNEEQLRAVWINKILPLLEEYYFFDKKELEERSNNTYTVANGWNPDKLDEFISFILSSEWQHG